jgi:hypothetical protein
MSAILALRKIVFDHAAQRWCILMAVVIYHWSIILITFKTDFRSFSRCRMPPKRKKQCKRSATASADGPSSQHSRRSSTINATMATRSANQPPSVNMAPTASVPPVSDAVSTETVLLPELLQTLVSTVTAEVVKQLSTQLPTPVPVASTDHQPVPTYMPEPSSRQSQVHAIMFHHQKVNNPRLTLW